AGGARIARRGRAQAAAGRSRAVPRRKQRAGLEARARTESVLLAARPTVPRPARISVDRQRAGRVQRTARGRRARLRRAYAASPDRARGGGRSAPRDEDAGDVAVRRAAQHVETAVRRQACARGDLPRDRRRGDSCRDLQRLVSLEPRVHRAGRLVPYRGRSGVSQSRSRARAGDRRRARRAAGHARYPPFRRRGADRHCTAKPVAPRRHRRRDRALRHRASRPGFPIRALAGNAADGRLVRSRSRERRELTISLRSAFHRRQRSRARRSARACRGHVRYRRAPTALHGGRKAYQRSRLCAVPARVRAGAADHGRARRAGAHDADPAASGPHRRPVARRSASRRMSERIEGAIGMRWAARSGRGRSVGLLVVRRSAAALPVLLGVSLLVFVVVDLLPGSAARQLLGPDASPAQVAALERALGLDRPAWRRYAEWLGGALQGDLGESLASGQKAARLVGERSPVTFQLVSYALVAALAAGVAAALLAARWPDRRADRLTMIASLVGLSTPSYLIAVVLVLVFAVGWPLFPSVGYTPLGESASGHLRSMTLPAAALALPMFGLYCRFLRGDLLEQMREQGYVIAARAKGLGPWRVLVGHALRNSLVGSLTVVGVNIGNLLGGTVIIEQIFALPGLGQ